MELVLKKKSEEDKEHNFNTPSFTPPYVFVWSLSNYYP